MKGLTIFNRTTKKEGSIKLRFRLRDGRDVDLYHKSEIRADLKDLEKFTPEGNVKPRVSIYNRELKTAIELEIAAIEKAYRSLCEKKDKSMILPDEFEDTIDSILHPEKIRKSKYEQTLLERLLIYKEEGIRDGIFGKERGKHYMVVYRELERFLIINKKQKILPSQLDADMLMELRLFLADEYKFVDRYPSLYDQLDKKCLPTEHRSRNTIAGKLRILQAFYNELVARDEVMFSPFTKLGKQRKQGMMHEEYDDPVCLEKEELQKIMNTTDVPESLIETRECFLLQCAFGCRVSEFRNLSMANVSVNPEGIPFIHYIAKKTIRVDHVEKVTPILRYALDLIKKWNFTFPILKNINGKSGYNVKIKELLKHCGLDRTVTYFNEEKGEIESKPLYEAGSSKLCRKTFVDMINKAQINMYAAGLHKEGSNAVERYTNIGLKDRFILYSAAFEQPTYKVDNDLNIINETTV